jgi:hypothetical protein
MHHRLDILPQKHKSRKRLCAAYIINKSQDNSTFLTTYSVKSPTAYLVFCDTVKTISLPDTSLNKKSKANKVLRYVTLKVKL